MLKHYNEFILTLKTFEGTVTEKYDAGAWKLISEGIFWLQDHNPILADMLNNLKILEHPNLPGKTMATDGIHLWYDKDFVKKLVGTEVAFVLAHEILHCMCGHFNDMPEIQISEDFRLLNMACDYAINQYLMSGFDSNGNVIMSSNVVGKPLKSACYDEKYKDMNYHEIYNDLKKPAIITIRTDNPAIKEAEIALNSVKNTIYLFKVNIKTANALLKQLTFTTKPGYNSSDVSKFQLFYADSRNLNNMYLIGEITNLLGAGLHTFRNLRLPLLNGENGIFWITADIPNNAIINSKISVSSLTEDDFLFLDGEIITVTNDGEKQTIVQKKQEEKDKGKGQPSDEKGQGQPEEGQGQGEKQDGGGNGEEEGDGEEQEGNGGKGKEQDSDKLRDLPSKTQPQSGNKPGTPDEGESGSGKPEKGEGTASSGIPGAGEYGSRSDGQYGKEGDWTIVVKPGTITGGISTPMDKKADVTKTAGGATITTSDETFGVSGEELKEKWADIVRTSKGVFATGSAKLDIIFNRLCTGRVNWKSVLKKLIKTALTTFKKQIPNRRQAWTGNYLPALKTKPRGYKRAVIVVDTSGSMIADDKLMRNILDEIYNLCYKGTQSTIETIHLVWCDDVVRGIDVFDKQHPITFEKMEPRGGGATDFRLPFEWINEQITDVWHEKPAFVVYLTDAEGTFPTLETVSSYVKRLFWVIYNTDEKIAPVGATIFIPEKTWNV